MEINKTIKINVAKSGKYIVCSDAQTVALVLGTKAATGNYNLYNVVKQKNKWYVPIEVIKERINCLEQRMERIKDALEIMRQIL